MVSDIGIKVANGEFYPIIGENSTVKKRLVLTTVHDNQQSVQIDLYKSYTRTMVDALYIGSLILESIKPRPKGEPSIELVISSSVSGEITAEAVDMDTSVRGEHQTLKVSLKSLESDMFDTELPDFELEQNELPPTSLYEKSVKVNTDDTEGEKKIAVGIKIGIAVVIVALIAAALWFFFLRDTGRTAVRPSVLPPPAVTQPPAQPPAVRTPPSLPPTTPPTVAEPRSPTPPPAVTPPPVIQAPARPVEQPAAPSVRQRPPAPVSSFKVPATIPKEGFRYRIRYGDTLWDIAEAFYRDPFLYPRIARFNNIRNPDRIISGSIINVPPRN